MRSDSVKNMSAYADQNHTPSLTDVRLEFIFRPLRPSVAVHLYCSQQRDFADASHSKSAKSAARAVSYGIFSSENSYMQVKHLFCAESLRILAERLSQSETQLPLRQICYYSPPEEVGVFSTEIKTSAILPAGQKFADSARYVE